MARALDYNATIVERADVTGALSIFRIQPDELPRTHPWFTAGQYCVLGLNNAEAPELGSVRRPMSIASAPEDRGPVEFYIRLVPRPDSRNPLTHLLWRLHGGDRIYIRTVAAGVFTIPATVGVGDPRIRVMVAAGTGLAPFVSILRSEVRRNPRADLSRWVLLHGASYPADLGYREELQGLAASHHLKYWSTVSRPHEAPDWTGDVGRVESFFDPDRLPDLERRAGLPPGGFTPRNTVIYVCGLSGTLTATTVAVIDRGFIPGLKQVRSALGIPPDARDSVFYEHFGTEPPIDIKDPAFVEPLRARMQAALAKL